MTFFRRALVFFIFFAMAVFNAKAQDSAIGYWESHLPYNSALGVATDGKVLFTAGVQAFFTFDQTNPTALPIPYSKVEGMSDIGMKCVGYDAATSTAVLVYANGNIDLMKDNTFYNVADLKVKNVSGNKEVFQVYTENGFAYLSTSLGILVIDLTNHRVQETYKLIDTSANNEIIPITGFCGAGQYFYATTAVGLYRVNKNNPRIQDYHEWERLNNTYALTNITNVKNTLFLSTLNAVYVLSADTLKPVYNTVSYFLVKHLDAGSSNLYISEYNDTTFVGSVKTMNTDGVLIDSVKWNGKPLQVTERADGGVWVADFFAGLSKIYEHALYPYIPAGPSDPSSFDIYANNKNIYIAHGGFNSTYKINNNHSGISYLKDGKWNSYSGGKYPALNETQDFVAILKDEKKGIFYAGSYLNGLFEINPDGTANADNASFDPSSTYFGKGERQVTGITKDHSENIWVTTYSSVHQLYAKSAADGTWYKFFIPNLTNGGPVVVDDNDQIWFVAYPVNNAGGVSVYNYGHTLGDLSDDASYQLFKGVGAGNLPSNNVFCIAKDNSNNIWVGTDNGIGIISNCSAPFSQTPPCDAEIPIVQYDKYAGYLFAGNGVRTIAVDGGNRKWIGTDDGVWLLSPDASKIIYRFTVDNSPLPSNHVQKISIDNVTGDVYIGTEMGLICYRSTATGGGESNSNVLVYPNPIHSGYTGPISIKGLVTDADVRITDVAGQLVYHTTAYGGQAVWNGIDYTGRRPQSGVYLVFATNKDGTQTYSGKIVFMQ